MVTSADPEGGVVQYPPGSLGHAPTHSSMQDSTLSSALHPQLLLFYLAVTCVCLIMAYFLDSKRRSSKRSRNAAKSDAPEANANNPILAEPGDWVRPLGNLETFMEVGGEYGSLNTVQAIWLSSSEPINPNDVRQAIFHVVERTHMLQVCVEWRGMRPWFKRMKEISFDFEVEEDDVMAVLYILLQKPYDMLQGPLWRARLIPIPKQSADAPYQAAFIFSAHHCMTDGHTNMQICRDTIELINAAITGRTYAVPIRPIIPAVADSLLTKRDWCYVFSYFWRKLYSTMITNYSKKLYFNGALKQPQTKVALTKILRENFTVEETKLIMKYCKEAGVAVHSCIMTTANLALLRTVQQLSKYRVDEAKINTVNCVNMRRYFPEELKDSPGCHISLEEKEILIPGSAANSKEHFWSLVKVFQNNLNESLNVKQAPIKNSPLFRPSTILLHVNYELTRRGLKNRTDNHMISTNMGNLKQLLPAKYDGPVEITDLLRSVSSELTGNPFTLVFHTFNDRFMISIDYYTNKMTDESASQFFSNLTEYIGNIARYGTVQEPVPALDGYLALANSKKSVSGVTASPVPGVNGIQHMNDVKVHSSTNSVMPNLNACAVNGSRKVDRNYIMNCSGYMGVNSITQT